MDSLHVFLFFFFNDTATTEIYTLSLHDALPISFLLFVVLILVGSSNAVNLTDGLDGLAIGCVIIAASALTRSEEHTSELQSLAYLVCRLLLEKKKNDSDLCSVMTNSEAMENFLA